MFFFSNVINNFICADTIFLNKFLLFMIGGEEDVAGYNKQHCEYLNWPSKSSTLTMSPPQPFCLLFDERLISLFL